MELLGSSILADATRCCIVKKLYEYKRMKDRILMLDGLPGLFLLKNAFSLPRLVHTLRSAPCHPELLAEYDVITRSTTEALRNIHLDDNSWTQAKLPNRYGGLGLRTAEDLALPVFFSSCAASISLVNDILRQPTNKQEDDDEVRGGWTKISSYLPTLTSKEIGTIFSALQPSPPWFPYSTSIVWHVSRRLRVLSLASGLTASKTTESSLSLTTTLSVSASLSASDSLSVFLIDANVERRWTHSVLTLCHAASAQGAFLAIRRGLSAAGIQSMLEPSGVDRGDGKRPDGITVYHYSHGRCLIWDATCVSTFASLNLIRAALAAGSVTDAAEVRKIAKYADLGRRFIFQPVAVETPAPWGNRRSSFWSPTCRAISGSA